MMKHKLMRLPGADVSWAQAPAAIAAIVIILGASYYLWRKRYIRGPAAIITILGLILILGFCSFAASTPPT